ncbi:MAG TPA: hypothetical protein VN903_35650 [Polyangia bacterium]|nr:hypothetical protein [Polyangia bacterium]
MNTRRVALSMSMLVALTLSSLGLGGCGGGGGGGNEIVVPPGQSLVIITVDYAGGVPTANQIRLTVHNGGAGDIDLYYPIAAPGPPILAGSTLGVQVPNMVMGLLDLTVRGLDATRNPVGKGTGQAMLVPDAIVYKTVTLEPCGATGC